MAEEYKHLPSIAGGLNTHRRSDLVQDHEVSDILNMRLFEDSVVLSKGYELLNNDLADGTVSDYEELGKRMVQYRLSTGTTVLILITNAGMYQSDGNDWNLIPRDTTVTVSGVDAGTDTITSAGHLLTDEEPVKYSSTLTFPTGIAVDVVYYVTGATANTFQLALTAAGSAIDLTGVGSGTMTVTPCFAGIITEPVCYAFYPPLDALVWSNGVDVIQKYAYATGSFTLEPLGGLTGGAMSGTATVVTGCRSMAVWNDRLYIFNTIEDSLRIPQMIRWSDVANIEEWDDAGAADGGFLRLSDREDHIQAALRLGDDMIAYRDHSIVKGQWVGSATRTAKWTEMVSEEGILGPSAVADVGSSHIFFGWNDIYEYKGGNSITPVGTKIRRQIFGEDGLLDLERDVDITMKHIRSLKEVWCSMLVGTSSDALGLFDSYKSLMLIYNVVDKTWTKREFGYAGLDIRISDVIEARIEAGITWADMEQTWQQIGELAWNTQIFATDFPNLLMCSKHDIFNYDHVIAQDNGVDIPFRVDTKDFESGNQFTRVGYLNLETSGNGCDIYYSVDKGNNFVYAGAVAASVSFIKTKVGIDVSSQSMRFRLIGVGGGFKVSSLGFTHEVDSEF